MAVKSRAWVDLGMRITVRMHTSFYTYFFVIGDSEVLLLCWSRGLVDQPSFSARPRTFHEHTTSKEYLELRYLFF
jgi:hypothetical protein